MTRTSDIDHSWLLKEVRYNPETGLMYWRKWHRGRPALFESIGSMQPNGYLVVTIAGERHLVHRLAFFYMTGQWPKDEIDHINRDRLDNRWVNLRDVPRSVNAKNRSPRRVMSRQIVED